jgi:hypothetical protein
MSQNCQFDSQPPKVKNRHDFLACRCRATYLWKSLDEGYNLALELTSIRRWHTKLWASKVMRVPILGISIKWHLGANSMAMHKEYYKGEGGGFPKSGPWWVLWVHVYPWIVCAPKTFPLRTNQLVVWFVQVHVNNQLACNLPSPHPRAPTCPSTLEMLRAKEHTQVLLLLLSSPLDSQLSPSRSLGCVIDIGIIIWTIMK